MRQLQAGRQVALQIGLGSLAQTLLLKPLVVGTGWLRVPPPDQIGSEEGSPLPSAHTTVRTVPYTAVRKLHYLAVT